MNSLDIPATVSDEVVALANRLAEDNPDADPWEIADGLLSGAVHWWLYANTPCDDPSCEDCAAIRNAELRMKTLHELVTELATTSEYYHSPNDDDVAHD